MSENPYSSPEAVPPPDLAEPSLSRRFQLASIAASLLLMAAAGAVAHPPLGRSLVIRCALPWFLQWAAVGVVLATVIRRRYRLGWGPVYLALFWPFIVGTVFWVGVCATFWNLDPREAVVKAVMLDWSLEMGLETDMEFMVYRFLGPLVCPLTLSGPHSMQGFGFLLAGLSTAGVTGYWLWAGVWCNAQRGFWGLPTRREFTRILIATLIYFTPPLLRLAIDLTATVLRWCRTF